MGYPDQETIEKPVHYLVKTIPPGQGWRSGNPWQNPGINGAWISSSGPGPMC